MPALAVGALALLVGLIAGALIGVAVSDDGDEDVAAATTTTTTPASAGDEAGEAGGAASSPCAGALSEAEEALREVRGATEAVSGFDADALRASIELLDETARELRDAVEECRRAVDR